MLNILAIDGDSTGQVNDSWVLKSELELYKKLAAIEEHKEKSAREIRKMVLGERLDLKKGGELYRTIRGIEYEGDL